MSLTDLIGATYLEQGRAAAQAAANKGQIWGGAIRSLGQIPQVMEQQKAAEQERQIRAQQLQMGQLQMAGLQKAQQDQQKADQVVAGLPRNADGTFNTPEVLQQLSANGIGSEEQKRRAEYLDAVNKIILSSREQKADQNADLANALLEYHKGSNEPLTPEDVHSIISVGKLAGFATPQDEQEFLDLIASNPDPLKLLQATRDSSKKYRDLNKPIVIPRGGTLATPAGQTIATGQPEPVTEAALALQAAQGQPAAIGAMQMLKPQNERPTGAEDDARYEKILTQQSLKQPVSAEDQAWSKAYEQRKLLGPETSAAAAANRQAATIAASTAQQGRAQAFTEQQAGRKEYTDKVATPYQTALASAQTLRDTIAAARAGNLTAANLQNLETTMAAIRAQGLNRINTTEIGVAANAGTLWDRIQGRLGSLIAGQPVPADLQKNAEEFAGILEKAATVKYQKGRASLLQTYKGLDLPDEAAAGGTTGGPREGDVKPIEGYPGTEQTYRGGKWIRTK